MSRYERTYGTDWTPEQIDRAAAIERAYALGVATALDEPVSDELSALVEAVDSAYDRTVVELAYDEGRTEARAATEDGTDAGQAWTRLVEETPRPTDRSGPPDLLDQPEALDPPEALDRIDPERSDAIELPEFLRRE